MDESSARYGVWSEQQRYAEKDDWKRRRAAAGQLAREGGQHRRELRWVFDALPWEDNTTRWELAQRWVSRSQATCERIERKIKENEDVRAAGKPIDPHAAFLMEEYPDPSDVPLGPDDLKREQATLKRGEDNLAQEFVYREQDTFIQGVSDQLERGVPLRDALPEFLRETVFSIIEAQTDKETADIYRSGEMDRRKEEAKERYGNWASVHIFKTAREAVWELPEGPDLIARLRDASSRRDHHHLEWGVQKVVVDSLHTLKDYELENQFKSLIGYESTQWTDELVFGVAQRVGIENFVCALIQGFAPLPPIPPAAGKVNRWL